MCKGMKILISDDGSDFVKVCRNTLTQKGYHVSSCGRDGDQVFAAIQSEHPDLVVMNLYMRQMDAIAVLENLDEIHPRFILLTPFIDAVTVQIFTQRAQETARCHPILLPVKMETLIKRIERLCALPASPTFEPDLPTTQALTALLHRLGIPAHISGHTYLRCSIEMAIEDPDITRRITTRLYPKLAERFHSTPSRVERAMRHAIEVAWTRGDFRLMEQIFGHTISDSRSRPTNSEFIAMLADYIRINGISACMSE